MTPNTKESSSQNGNSLTNKRPVLICLVGMDGTGKTTQAQMLVQALNNRGIRSKYAHNLYQPILMKPFILAGKLLFFKGSGKYQNYENYVGSKDKIFSSKLIIAIYENFLLFDYWCQTLTRVTIPLQLGMWIVCDRYIYDLVVELYFDLNYTPNKLNGLLSKFRIFFPKPHFTFLFDAPEELAFRRKSDTCSINYLKDRRQIYLRLGELCGMTIIDGTQEISVVQSKILEKIDINLP